MLEVTVDGHGGHMCEAYHNYEPDGFIWSIGETPEEAVYRILKAKNHQIDDVLVHFLPCETTAFERSKIYDNGKDVVLSRDFISKLTF